MTKLTIQGKFSGSTYPFVCYDIEDFLDPDQNDLTNARAFLFMIASINTTLPIANQNQIDNVLVIGSTISKQALIDKVKELISVTHVFIVKDNPWIEKHGVSEELILQFKPEQICFLSKSTVLNYVPAIPKS